MKEPALGLLESVHHGYGFYVLNQSIAMNRRFGMGQNVQVRCTLTHMGRSTAEGVQDVIREDGVQLAHCRIRGAWIGPKGQLARIPEQARKAVYQGTLESTRGDPEPGTPDSLFRPPEPLRTGKLDLQLQEIQATEMYEHAVTVRASDLDIFSHVNAANYVRYVADALATRDLSPSLHRAELKYVGQAREGDRLRVCYWDLGDHCHAAHILRDGTTLFQAVVETEPAYSKDPLI
ncbi:MAG: hypothetical protein KTR25_06800 [Myxococcales bacterium]|nr:hypothetical protein [Myxococcales bacterium]